MHLSVGLYDAEHILTKAVLIPSAQKESSLATLDSEQMNGDPFTILKEHSISQLPSALTEWNTEQSEPQDDFTRKSGSSGTLMS